MSLDANWTKIRDYEELFQHDAEGKRTRMDPTYESILFYTIIVNMGEITEENAAEFYARVALHETLFGAVVSGPSHPDDPEKSQLVDKFITPADVQRMIGLKTNVWPQETKLKFLRRMGERKLSELKYHYVYVLEKQPEDEQMIQKVADDLLGTPNG